MLSLLLLISTMPMLTPTFIAPSCHSKRYSRIAWRRLSAIFAARSAVQSCSRMPNSSPPRRAIVSLVRMRVCSMPVICFSKRSPAW